MTANLDPVLLNILYVCIGGLVTLMFMKLGCNLFNRMVSFNISDELAKGNIAVGLMVMGLFIGIGVALGLVIGLGLN